MPEYCFQNLIQMYKLSLKAEDFERANKIKALIDKEFHRHYLHKDFPKLVGSNEQTLKAAFKELTGKSPYEYLTHVRIQQAEHLLTNTDYTIDSIAKRVGLDRSNLSKQFRKINGKPPATWRTENKN
jgi:AraC-type DNA-binding domain-containing proteins